MVNKTNIYKNIFATKFP